MEQLSKKPSLFTRGWAVALAALVCCALWGSAAPMIKTGYALMLPDTTPASTILFAGIRFALAGALTILLYSIPQKRLLRPKREHLGKVAVISCFQTVIQYIFYYIGLVHTTGVKASVISASNVFFAILIAALVFRQERLTPRKLLACVIGFSGIIVINLDGFDLNMNFLGDGFILFSTIAYAVSSVLIKRYSRFEDPVVLSGYQFLLGGGFMVLTGLLFGGQVVINSMSGVGILLYLSLVSAVAYGLWGILLKHNPVSRVTVFSFMIPVFGVFFSVLLLNEQNTVGIWNLLLTLLLTSGGILLLNCTTEQQKTAAKKGAS